MTLWNQVATRAFGWSEVEIIGQLLPSTAENGMESLQDLIEQALRC